MERTEGQIVSDRADVNQLWSLIILTDSCSTSISFQFFTLSNGIVWSDDRMLPSFHGLHLILLDTSWKRTQNLLNVQSNQINAWVIWSRSAFVIDKRVHYTFLHKAWFGDFSPC